MNEQNLTSIRRIIEMYQVAYELAKKQGKGKLADEVLRDIAQIKPAYWTEELVQWFNERNKDRIMLNKTVLYRYRGERLIVEVSQVTGD